MSYYSQYDSYKTPMENIGLQDSLLSRFDLLFILLDKNEQEQDTMIADHVLRMHRYRNPGEQEGSGEWQMSHVCINCIFSYVCINCMFLLRMRKAISQLLV